MKLFSCVFTVFLLAVSPLTARHLIGGYMSYEITEFDGSEYTLEVSMTLYRDIFGSGAGFDPEVEFGLYYTNDGINYDHVRSFRTAGFDSETVYRIGEACNAVLSSYEVAKYEVTMQVPDLDGDFMISYQRCCRITDPLGIVGVDETGMAVTVYISRESLQAMNSSPSISALENRFIPVGEETELQLTFFDAEGDELIVTAITPANAGGLAGVNGTGDLMACDGVIPSPDICPPPYGEIIYEPGFSAQAPFGSAGSLTEIDKNVFTVRSDFQGSYVLAFSVEEYRGVDLLSSSYYETVITVGDDADFALQGKFYIDENTNGAYDAGEPPFVLSHDILSPFCTYTCTDGDYAMVVQEDQVTLTDIYDHWDFAAGTADVTSPQLSTNNVTDWNIGLVPAASAQQAVVQVSNLWAICDSVNEHTITVTNTGSTAIMGDLKVYDLVDMTQPTCQCAATLVNDTLTIAGVNLEPMERATYIVETKYGGSSLDSPPATMTTRFDAVDSELSDADFRFGDELFCPSPANRIHITPVVASDLLVEPNATLSVTTEIRNTTDMAATAVEVVHELDEDIDPLSVRIVGSTAPVFYSIVQTSGVTLCRMVMDDLQLPGPSAGIEANTAYITYSVDQQPDLPTARSISFSGTYSFDDGDVRNLNSSFVVVQGATSTTDITVSDASIYPSPTDGIFYVDSDEEVESITVYSVSGEVVREVYGGNMVNIAELQNQLYLVHISMQSGAQVWRKVVRM